MSRDVTLRHTGQDVESYLINTLAAAAADGLIVTLLISIVAQLSRFPSPSCRAGNIFNSYSHFTYKVMYFENIIFEFTFEVIFYGVSPCDLRSGSVS